MVDNAISPILTLVQAVDEISKRLYIKKLNKSLNKLSTVDYVFTKKEKIEVSF